MWRTGAQVPVSFAINIPIGPGQGSTIPEFPADAPVATAGITPVTPASLAIPMESAGDTAIPGCATTDAPRAMATMGMAVEAATIEKSLLIFFRRGAILLSHPLQSAEVGFWRRQV